MSSELIITQIRSSMSTLLPKDFDYSFAENVDLLHLYPPITDPKRIECVQKLRSNLGSAVLPFHTDHDLLRFLKTRKFNVSQTVIVYHQMLGYRKMYGLDKDNFLEAFKPNEVFIKYYPTGVVGCDKNGYPVVYDMPGRLDAKGFTMAITENEYVAQMLWNLENFVKILSLMSKAQGRLIDKWTVVIDAHGLTLEHLSSTQMARSRKMQSLFDICYPERMHKIVFLNCSRFFYIGYKLFNKFIPDATKHKLVILEKNEDIFNYIDPEQIPVVFGGTRVDNNGDGECKEWIRYGGEVPSSYYKQNVLSDVTKEWNQISVANGKMVEVPILAESSCSVLCYQLFSERDHISFAVAFSEAAAAEDGATSSGGVGKSGKKKRCWAKKMSKVTFGQQLIEDSIELDKKGTYYLVFDNKFTLHQTDPKIIRYVYSVLVTD